MKNGFRNNIMKLFSGSLLSQVVWMASMMFLVRIYQPENFATYQMFISTMNILAIFATARYDNAIIVPKYKWQATQILFLSISVSTVFFLIMELCLYFGEIIYFRIYGVYDCIWSYLPISVFLISVYSCLYNWYVRERRYTLISIVVFIFPILYLFFCIIMKKFFNVEEGLIFSFLISRFLEVFVLLIIYIRENNIRKIKYVTLRRCAFRYINFPKYMLVGGFVDTASSSVPVYFLNYFFGKEITGYYSIAMQALSAPAALVAKSVGDVFRQRIGELYSHNQNTRDFFDRNMILLVKISLIVAFCVIFFAPQMYVFAFGEQWYYSGELSRYMILGVCLSLIASPLSSIYIVSYNQKMYLFMQIAYLISTFTGIIIGKIFFGSVEWSLLIVSIEVSITSIISIYRGRMITF